MHEASIDGISKRLVLFVIMTASFLFAFTSSALNIALPRITEQLSLDAIMSGWIATAYLLSSATLLVPFGRLADIYGRKKIFTCGVVIYTISSFVAGLASSAAMLISCRVFQGMGGAMFAGTAVALLTTVFPSNERGKVLGMNIAVTYIGLSAGPVLGGIITQHLGWSSIFFFSASLGLVVITMVLQRLKNEWTGAKGERFDIFGSVIYVFGLVALIYGLTLLQRGSGMWLGACLIAGGAAGLWGFIRWETQVQSPILEISLFTNSKAFTFSNLAALINYSATWAVSYLLSFYLQYLKGLDPQAAGLILVSMPATQALFSPLAGRLSDRIEPRLTASAGMALTTLGLVILTSVTAETPLMSVIGNLILMGLGFAFFSSPNTNAVMSSTPKTAYGVASAMLATMRQVGMAFSMGIAVVMLALYMGKVPIRPENYPLFEQSMKMSFAVFAALCFAGIFASLARGRVR